LGKSAWETPPTVPETSWGEFTNISLADSQEQRASEGASSTPHAPWIVYIGTTKFTYQRWLLTQGIEPVEEYPEWVREGWLIEQPELHSQRGPE